MKSKKSASLPLLSICIPVLNESENIQELLKRLGVVELSLKSKCRVEYIFTDNASEDNTWEQLFEAKKWVKNLRAFRFGKNIGFQNSILFAYRQAKGDAIVQIDADLQDPPELIVDFFEYWLNGHKVVNGIRVRRKENKVMSNFRRFGYGVINLLSNHPIKPNVGDFRLIDRIVVDYLVELRVPNPYLRGFISKLSLSEVDVPYSREARRAGESKFGVVALIKLGLNAISNHSNFPLKLGNYVGAISLIISLSGLMYFTFMRFYQPEFPRGFASVYLLILFGIGVNAILLGIIGNSINKIYSILSRENPTIVTASI